MPTSTRQGAILWVRRGGRTGSSAPTGAYVFALVHSIFPRDTAREWQSPFCLLGQLLPALAAAAASLDGKPFRSFCQIDSLPCGNALVITYFKLPCRFTVAQLFLLHGFYNLLLELCCITLVRYSLWHNETPHFLVQVFYHTCLTNGVRFTGTAGSFYFNSAINAIVSPDISARIVPRCASQMLLAMESPMPKPPVAAVRDASGR